MPKLFFACLAAILMAGVIGFFLGRHSSDPTARSLFDFSSETAVSSVAGSETSHTSTGTSASSKKSSTSKSASLRTAADLRAAVRHLSSSLRHGPSGTKAWADLNARVASSDINALLQEFLSAGVTSADSQCLTMLIGALAETDPRAAWKLANTLPPSIRLGCAMGAIAAYAAQFPEEALAKIRDFPNTSQQRSLRSSAIQAIAASDPRRALALLGKPERGEEYLLNNIFSKWVLTDPTAAHSAASSLPAELRSAAMSALVTNLAETDPAAAWKLASENAPTTAAQGRYYADPRFQAIDRWAQSDPTAALAAACEVKNANTRNGLISNAIRIWADTDFDSALKYVSAITDPTMLATAFSALASNAGTNHAKVFHAILDQMPVGNQMSNAVSNILNNWAQTDPRAAAAAYAELPPGRHTWAIGQIVSQWATTTGNYSAPLDWVLSLPAGQNRNNGLNSIFNTWAQGDPRAALAAANRLSETERNAVYPTIASTWAQSDPSAALDWAKQLPAGQGKDNAVQTALSSLANSDPTKAIAALNSLGQNINRNQAITTIVGSWMNQDINAAAQWVRTLPDGAAKDNSYNQISSRLASDDPEMAIAWAAAIGNQQTRQNATVNVISQWQQYDPAAAKAWVLRSNLAPEIKERFLR